ncbi:MAG: S9 family peptidase [Phycisphaerales bacterium]|nr:S9 family peptidase [Phycisphaerales bacterium]
MLSTMITICILSLVILVLAAPAGRGAAAHPFTVHDLLAMDRISDPQALPDGDQVVFCVRATDLDANKGHNDLWLMNADGSGLRRLTNHPAGSSSPRFAPDGRSVYFLSSRTGSTQVWRIATDGGEAEQITDLPLDVGSLKVSPTGTHLAISMEVFPDAESLDDTKKRLDEMKGRKATGQVFEQLFIRHWDTWKDGRRSHLFVVPTIGGDAVNVMRGMDADGPPKPFGGDEECAFTPDGKSLVFACRNKGSEEAWSTHFDLYVVPIDGSAAPKIIVDGKGAVVTSPVFSHDGRTLAFGAMARPGYEADRVRIALKSWPSGETRILTEDWDRSVGSLVWSHDDAEIYTTADEMGYHPLFAVDVATGNVRTVFGKAKVTGITLARDRLVFGVCHHQSPVELHAIQHRGGEAQPITGINADKVAAVKMGLSEQFTFKGWNDETVHAWVVKPVDFDPSRKYPVAFLIHGGPQGSFGSDFHYRWNPQVYAGAGYAAIMIDFHGSTGYGQAFTDAINHHWGDRPFEDLQKGLAAALKRHKWMDGKCVGALGASYGGYMINWIAGNWKGAFKCAICHDGNIDERMAYYDTEEIWFPEWERGGTPWDVPEAYTAHNPIDHVQKWDTPTLVIHSGKDYRVVDTQGISTFTALQRRGVASKLLYFPDENHWVLKPHNSIQWHDEVIGWLDRWLKA